VFPLDTIYTAVEASLFLSSAMLLLLL